MAVEAATAAAAAAAATSAFESELFDEDRDDDDDDDEADEEEVDEAVEEVETPRLLLLADDGFAFVELLDADVVPFPLAVIRRPLIASCLSFLNAPSWLFPLIPRKLCERVKFRFINISTIY